MIQIFLCKVCAHLKDNELRLIIKILSDGWDEGSSVKMRRKKIKYRKSKKLWTTGHRKAEMGILNLKEATCDSCYDNHGTDVRDCRG